MQVRTYVPPSEYSSFVYREKHSSQSRLDYDPEVTHAWTVIRFRQMVAMLLFPTVSLLFITLYASHGNVQLYIINLQTIAVIAALSNLVLIPFSLINYRCPRCTLYVTGNDPVKKARLKDYLINFRVRYCPNCQARLS